MSNDRRNAARAATTPPPSRRDAPAIVEAATPGQVAAVRALLVEYQAWLGLDLEFQGFARELATLPGDYAPPPGVLYLATVGGDPVGCIGVRRLAEGRCEMKRLFVRPAGRGRGVGRRLAEAAIARARAIGYSRMLLDTLPVMGAAQAMYHALGFVDVEPYRPNPIPGSRFLALDLSSR
jgi:putative acetyltransferase